MSIAKEFTCPTCMENKLEKVGESFFKCTNKDCKDFDKEQNGRRVKQWAEYVKIYKNGKRYECPECGSILRELGEWLVEDRIKGLRSLMANAIGRDITMNSSLSARERGQMRYPDENEYFCESCKRFFEKYIVKSISKIEVEAE